MRYGKIGTEGQTSVTFLSTPAEAKAHVEKKVSEKVKKGYKETKAKTAIKSVAKKAVKIKTVNKKVIKKKVAKKVITIKGDEIINFIVEELLTGYGSGSAAEDLIELFSYGEPPCRTSNLKEDKKNLIQFRQIEPRNGKWSIRLEEHFGDPTDKDDIWSGDFTTEEQYFCGNIIDFKIWIKKNREYLIKELDLNRNRIKKLDALITSFR